MMEPSWGLKPVLFYIEGFPVEAYPVFVFLALLTGIAIYKLELKRDNIQKSNAFYIAIFAIFGGILGSKIPIIFMYWKELNSDPNNLQLFLSGRTIVGGLIGGTAGTFLAKKTFKIKERLGNQLAIPVAISMAVGRIGCLLRGCCYGQPTRLPWGLDFGDHVLRHPTQIYEILFDIGFAIYLSKKKKRGVLPGELFRSFLNGYLGFRFFLEFIRVEKISAIGLTDFQLLCVISLIYINRKFIIRLFKRKDVRAA